MTMDDGAAGGRKDRLSATKRALLDAWMQTTAVPAGADAFAGGDGEPFASFPLTEVQEAYWLGRHRTFELGVAPASYLEIEVAELDVDRLRHALERLIARHEMLRAVVQPDGTQRVLETAPALTVPVHELASFPEDHQRARVEAIRARLTQGISDPARWPLFAVEVSRGSAATLLHVMFDILIVDMHSVRILTRDLSRLYADPDAQLPPLGPSFRAHVLRREARKTSPSYARARAYWLGRLASLPPSPPLPLACAPRDLIAPRFVRYAGRLPRDVWQEIKRRTAARKLTPTGVLLTAFAQVLARRSASSHFTLNLTMYNRPGDVAGIDEVVGDFTSLTLVECDLSATERVADRAARLQRQLWADLEHRDFDGVEVLRERRRLTGNAQASMPIVFTSNLLHERGEVGALPVLGRVVTSITQTPQVWIDHQAAEQDGELVYGWDVPEGLFPPDFVEEMRSEYHERVERLRTDAAWDEVEHLTMVCTAAPSIVEPAAPPPREPVTVRVTDHVLGRVLGRAREVLGGRAVTATDSLIQLGLTSIGFVRLANALQVDLGVRPELESLLEQTNATGIAALYETLLGDGDHATPEAGDAGLIVEPSERARFTEARHGLRRDLDAAPRISLPRPSSTRVNLDLGNRRTYRAFAVKPVTLDALATVLSSFRELPAPDGPRFAYPSAGGLYPVQVYLHVKPGRVAGLAGGYYYHPSEHALVQLDAALALDRKLHGWNNRAAFDQSAFSLFFVADRRAMAPLYGRLTHDFTLVEAGAMLELAMLLAASAGIGLCPVGRVDDRAIRTALAWHADHVLVHSVLGGIPAAATQGSPVDDLRRQVGELSEAEVEALLERSDKERG